MGSTHPNCTLIFLGEELHGNLHRFWKCIWQKSMPIPDLNEIIDKKIKQYNMHTLMPAFYLTGEH